MNTLALDIGGVNVKAAHSVGGAWSQPFITSRAPEELGSCLSTVFSRVPGFDRLAVTMTAELCDCFDNKKEGVKRVLDIVLGLAGKRGVGVWSTEGRFVHPEEAGFNWLRCASANWHALGTFAAGMFPEGQSLLIDTGSSTTDILLLDHGVLRACGWNDPQRLVSGELVYVGAERTPLMALGPDITFNGHVYRLTAEPFATTADVFVLTNEREERPDDCDTCDGQPLTKLCSATRVARMIGADLEMISLDDATRLGHQFAVAVRSRIVQGIEQVVSGQNIDRVIVSGSGEFLAASAASMALPQTEVMRLGNVIGESQSVCACAYALLKLLDRV